LFLDKRNQIIADECSKKAPSITAGLCARGGETGA